MSEDPAEFRVGVNNGRYAHVLAHFNGAANEYTRINERETVKYLGRTAVDLYGDSLCSSNALFTTFPPTCIRVIDREGSTVLVSKSRFTHLPDGEPSVLPEGFKMTLSRETVLLEEQAVMVANAFSTLPEGVFTR